jgi:hypothetical protein
MYACIHELMYVLLHMHALFACLYDIETDEGMRDVYVARVSLSSMFPRVHDTMIVHVRTFERMYALCNNFIYMHVVVCTRAFYA